MHKNDPEMQEIKKELDLILTNWLILHQKLVWFLVIITILLEMAFAIILNYMDGFVSTSPSSYLIKYLLFPVTINILLASCTSFVCKTKGLSVKIKCYAVSILMTAVCTVIFTVHSIFPTLNILFVICILLTAAYGDLKLTTIIAAINFIVFVICDLFVFWDSSRSPIIGNSNNMLGFILTLILILGVYWFCMSIILHEQEKNFAIAHQIIEQRRLRSELFRDSLTGLGNRKALREALDKMTNQRRIKIFAMMDLDKFKQINDIYGHLVGDKCLKYVSNILMEECPDHQLFRYGGDEFCMLLNLENCKDAVELCNKITERLKKSADTLSVELSCSFGLAIYTSDISVHDLIQHADDALYQAKYKRCGICCYSSSNAPV